jgi:phage-related tail protein
MMKKLSLLVGTLGGAMAGYLFSNKRLREQLGNAKDAESAARLLGKHLQHDGKKLANQVREFVESDEVQKNVTKAKKYASKKMNEAKKELNTLVKKGTKKAKKTVKRTAARTKATVKRRVAAVRRPRKKARGKTRKKSGRVRTSTRKLS